MASSTKVVAEEKKNVVPVIRNNVFFLCMANLIFEDVP